MDGWKDSMGFPIELPSCFGEYWSIIVKDVKNRGKNENLWATYRLDLVFMWICGGWVEKQNAEEWKKGQFIMQYKKWCTQQSAHVSVTNYMISPAASLSPCSFSYPERIQGGGPEQEDDSDPGGGAGLWQLHEQGPERQCLRLQGLQSQQDRWHQVQHRQVGQERLWTWHKPNAP